MVLTLCPNPSVDKFLQLEKFRPGEVHKSLNEQAFAGGKGVHVARALNELGTPAVLIGFWGGPPGQWICQTCEAEGVPCLGPETEGWTRTCLTIRSKDGSETELRERGPDVDQSLIDLFFQTVDEQLSDVSALCVSGSWPPGTTEGVYRRLKEISDSIRRPLWVDASGEHLKRALETEPHAIHINRSEAVELFGDRKPVAEYAERLLSHCNLAAVTDGANGLWLASDKEMVHAECPVDTIYSTVGCGDALLAGLIASSLRRDSLEEMARFGTACGAANCLSIELGMIKKGDVDQLIQTTVTRTIMNNNGDE